MCNETKGKVKDTARQPEQDGQTREESASSGGFPSDMAQMAEMMGGKGCGPMMKEMMAHCCGSAGHSESSASEAESRKEEGEAG